MLREIEDTSSEQTQLKSQEQVIGFESIFARPFAQALGKPDKGLDYAGSCDCDAGPCYSCNCNCVIGCT